MAPAPGDHGLEEVRKICDRLPERMVDGDQHHELSVRARTLGWHLVDHHGDGRVALVVKAARGANTALVASDPAKFFLPAYVAHHGYVGIYLDTGTIDWDEVRELVTDAYRLVAPKALTKLID